jgi:hypothetical protein
MDGYIKKVCDKYAFIRSLQHERDVFLHPSDLHKSLTWGEHLVGLPVTFNLTEDDNGRLKATRVRAA